MRYCATNAYRGEVDLKDGGWRVRIKNILTMQQNCLKHICGIAMRSRNIFLALVIFSQTIVIHSVFARRMKDAVIKQASEVSQDINKVNLGFNKEQARAIVEEMNYLIRKGPYKMTQSERNKFLQSVIPLSITDTEGKKVLLLYGVTESIRLLPLILVSQTGGVIFGMMLKGILPYQTYYMTIPFAVIGGFGKLVSGLTSMSFADEGGKIYLNPFYDDNQLRAAFYHEAIHALKFLGFIKTDITAVSYEVLRAAELSNNGLISNAGSVTGGRSRYFEKGVKLMKLDLSFEKRANLALKFAKKKIILDKVLDLAFGMYLFDDKEYWWHYRYGAILGGMAYELGQQLGNPDAAWVYLNLITNGKSPMEAERIVRKK